MELTQVTIYLPGVAPITYRAGSNCQSIDWDSETGVLSVQLGVSTTEGNNGITNFVGVAFTYLSDVSA